MLITSRDVRRAAGLPIRLTERRRSDRETMAAALTAAAVAGGATVERRESGPRAILVRINGPRGANIGVTFDGDSSQPDVHVATWNIDDSDARFATSFGSVNECHYQKATRVCYGFEALLARISADLEALASGAAFNAAREAEMIVRHGTAAARAARLDAWFASVLGTAGPS